MPTDERLGRLYRVDRDASVTAVDDGFDVLNGMAFSPDRETFYATESEAHTVYAYDYDEATGALSGKRTAFEANPADGVPDGMAWDA